MELPHDGHRKLSIERGFQPCLTHWRIIIGRGPPLGRLGPVMDALSANRRRYPCWPSSPVRNGLSTIAPRPAMSRSLAVTSVRPLVTAVAASKPSMTGIGLTALIRPHWSETALSMPKTRPSNAASTCRSHRSSAAALSGSPGRASSTPLRISPRTSVLKKRSSSAIEAYHVEHVGCSGRPFGPRK